jgi:hypothetical protein
MMNNPFDLYEKRSEKAQRRLRQATRNIQSALQDLSAGKISAVHAGKRIGRTCVSYKDVGARDSAVRDAIVKHMQDRGFHNVDIDNTMTEVNDIIIYS